MNLVEKWKRDYIEDLDLTQIEWVKLNSEQLNAFYYENYLDKEACQWVNDYKPTDTLFSPIGQWYLSYDTNQQYSYLLGLVPNRKNKKTIVAAMIYLDSYFLYEGQETPVTYISSIETNSYFRNKGLCRQLFDTIIKFINPEQHVIISPLSELGRKCNLFEKLKKALIKNGFKKMIYIDDYTFDIYKFIAKQKKLGTMPLE